MFWLQFNDVITVNQDAYFIAISDCCFEGILSSKCPHRLQRKDKKGTSPFVTVCTDFVSFRGQEFWEQVVVDVPSLKDWKIK